MPPTKKECVGTLSQSTGWRACRKVVKGFCRPHGRVEKWMEQLQVLRKVLGHNSKRRSNQSARDTGVPMGPHPSMLAGRCMATW